MNIRPAYPPQAAPLAPVPSAGPQGRIYPDGLPASPAPSSQWAEAGHGLEEHGIQAKGRWAPGETKAKGLIDDLRARNLWRVTAFGGSAMRCDLKYGTKCTITLVGLSLPLRASVPGQCSLEFYPVSEQQEEQIVVVSLTPATSGGLIELVRPVTGPFAFDDKAFRYTALTASALVIRGVGVAVPALSSVRLVAGSTLTSGDGFEEFDT
jgi:hypothetical protein